MNGIDWFPVSQDHGALIVEGQSGPPLKIIVESGELLAVKRSGGRYRGLAHTNYAEARFEIWEIRSGKGRKRLSFPVRS